MLKLHVFLVTLGWAGVGNISEFTLTFPFLIRKTSLLKQVLYTIFPWCVIDIFYKTSSGCQISFLANKIFSSASERSSFSASTTRCHCDQRIASRYLLMRSTVADLSRMITRPIGRRILSISSNRSSVLHPAFSISENTFHACRRSYVRGYVEKASHLQWPNKPLDVSFTQQYDLHFPQYRSREVENTLCI